MKHLRMLGFAVMVSTALMAFAGSASANPVLTSPAGTEYTGALTATLTGSMLLKANVFQETCAQSTIGSEVTTNNTTSAGGAINTITFNSCGGLRVIFAPGSLEVLPTGVVKSSGTQITWARLGVSCVYGTATGTTLGTLTGGNPAIINIKASLPKISGGFLCANPGSWEGQYTVTTPKPLLLN
jgi:hypothetical protein